MAWLIPSIVIVAIIIAAFLYYSPSFRTKANVTAIGPFDLSSKNTIVPIADSAALLDPSDSTFQAFVYLNPMMRTGAHVECGTGINQPSCADGIFQPCKCSGADCGPCAHASYFPIANLLGMAILEVMPAPDASRQGQVGAQLSIKTVDTNVSTNSPTAKFYIETIPLPEITLQKWMMVTITRSGREFSIYYNNALMVSKKTMFMPISDRLVSNGTGIISGSSNLGGQIANITIYPKRLTVLDVERNYKAMTDTRGSPYVYSSSTPTLSTIGAPTVAVSTQSFIPSFNLSSLSLCFTGDCLNAPTVVPPNGKMWYSSFA